MKKIISLLILLSAFCFTANSQIQIQVAAPGLPDVCGPNIASLVVVSPPAGYTFTWYIQLQGNCGTTISNIVGSGTTYFVQTTGYYYCYATPNGGGTPLSSNTVPVRVLPNTGMTIFYGNLNCVASATLCIPYVFYTWGGDVIKWYKNNVLINGATSDSYTATTSGHYKYSVASTNVMGLCSATTFSDSVLVTIATANITASGSTNLCNGASVTLNANTGTGLTYQWTINNQVISGATSDSYTTSVGGTYRCIVTNSNGCSTTSNFINVATGAAPTATITPSGTINFCAGSALTLTANTGTGITYQWYKNGVAQAGATSSSYLIGNAGTYYVVETSSCGTATSNSVVVNQINNPNPVMTYTTPTTFCTPGTITFTANTFAGVTYQWQKNSIDLAGATNQTYTATTNGKYRVKQTANGCTKQGQDVQVTTATSVTAVITANGPTSFCTGGSVVLSVSNAVPGYSYQWKNNATNISGATTSSYTATTAGSYTCYVSASCGNATSNAIVVSTGGIVALVNPSGTVNVCNGATVAMSANTGTGFTFQWKKNGTNISGATGSSYNATTAGAYTVAITSPCGNTTSAATTVNIAALAASITPTGTTTICNGQAATFTANTGYNFTYQWYRNGGAITGATSSTHANSSAGNYTVVISQGGVCSATSNIAVLAVTNNPNPSVTAGGPTTFCVGQSVVLTANTFAGVTYQWTKNGTNIAGATNQTYTATTSGQYSVKETANGCTKQLGVPIVVTVNCREEGIGYEGTRLNEIKVAPNPFTDECTVYGLQFTVGDRIELVNVLGKTILTKIITEPTENCKLQTVNIPSGIYFLQLITQSEKKTVKVVKQ